MQIHSLLTPSRTLCGIAAQSKRQALEILAQTIAQDIPALNASELLRLFLARERLGSTAIGYGIAIPHCRIEQKNGAALEAISEAMPETIGALITLAQPVEFDALDAQPVDILFAMLVPEAAHNEHLQNLAALASALNNDQFRLQLRAATSHSALYLAATQGNTQRNPEGAPL
jgi:nitrogen PTS system EIIA component